MKSIDPNQDNIKSQKILILQTAFLGDLLLCIPLIKSLRQKYPNHTLELVCRAGCGAIFQELRLVDTVYEVNKSNKPAYKKLIKNLRSSSYDIIFSPHYSVRSLLIVRSLKAKCKVGFKQWWTGGILTHSVERDLLLPDALRQLQLLSIFDAEIQKNIQNYLQEKKKFQKIDLSTLKDRPMVPEFASMNLKAELQSHPLSAGIVHKFLKPQNSASTTFVFLAPGSVWNTKKWTAQGYRETARILSEKSPVFFIGSAQERSLCEEIRADLPNTYNLAGEPSLFELFLLLTHCSLLICNDSGSMHMGSVAGTPTVSIFGPTVLELGYQPWQNQALVVENTQLKCRPCGKHGPKICPVGTHECMKSISANKVLQAAQDVHVSI